LHFNSRIVALQRKMVALESKPGCCTSTQSVALQLKRCSTPTQGILHLNSRPVALQR
jgi:hypothetical protein